MDKDVKHASSRETKASRPKNKYGLTGKRLGIKGVMATALLECGLSIPKVREATGISQTTAVFLKREKVMPREQVEALKTHLQTKFARIAAEALDAIDPEKYQQAGFGELVRGAALATQHAGLSSPNGLDSYRELIFAKYTIHEERDQTSGTTSAPSESAHPENPPAD
jgi:hypothetical protein